MKIPTRQEAESFLTDAKRRNPGPWVQHSIHVAEAARIIASHHPRLDPEAAFLLGYLHDIGRREGVTAIRHLVDGYRFLHEKGFEDAARICITHTFPIADIRPDAWYWDCSPEDGAFLIQYFTGIEFTEYDRLIQLCDSLALPSGFCVLEKRMVDVALRYGTDEASVPRWKALFSILDDFNTVIGQNIYKILPGVVKNTFGVEIS